jgi:hypothetical protein
MRRMIHVASTFLVAAILTLSPAQAQSTEASASLSPAASSHGRGIGVGAVTMLNGTSGALVTWGSAGGGFHVDGLFGLHHDRPNFAGANNVTDFTVGGRFWYHVHAASFADFSLGGGLGITNWSSGAPGSNRNTDVSLEVGAQIRAFIVPNVALLADLGIGMTFYDNNDDILIGGQNIGGGNFVDGTLGIAYFFE